MRSKWKCTRTLLLLTALILGVSSVFIYLSVTGPTSSGARTPGLRPPSQHMAEVGQEVSLEQAQARVPFKIRLPTNIGNFVELRLEDEIDRVLIVYAASKPSDHATIDDVLNQNGIVLLLLPNEMTLQDATQNILDGINSLNTNSLGSNAQQVSINGYVGCAAGNVKHCVDWYTETTYYRLMANVDYPLQKLVAIAQTIPVK